MTRLGDMPRRGAMTLIGGLAAGAIAPAASGILAQGCSRRADSARARNGDRPSDTALTIRRSGERGHANRGWLDSYHSFSFADYHDPAHMGFRNLRVINEDRIAASGGFPMHPHRDMEIVTYVLDGALEHRDSMGNGSVIRPGEVQRMSAGTGIRHSEFNASVTAGVHLLQIWLLPSANGVTPSYEQKVVDRQAVADEFAVLAAPTGGGDAVTIQTDARILARVLAKGQRAAFELAPSRSGWLQVARGAVRANGVELRAGDAAATSPGGVLELTGVERAEMVIFDLG